MLDCVQQHTVYVYDRGGMKRLFQLPKVNRVRWNRVRDDISEATVDLTIDQCKEQASLLDQIEPMRHELVIYRGSDRVWEGPITLTTETRTSLSISAKDIMYYVAKITMRNGYSNAWPNIGFVVQRAKSIIVAELGAKEAREQAAYPSLPSYNIIPWIVDHQTPTDAKTSAVTVRYQYEVQNHIDGLAADSGLDYTVVGRALHLWDTHKSLGVTQTVTENDFLGNIIISRYGSDLATMAHVTDGRGTVGSAGGIDPYYGEIENLLTAYDEEKDDETPSEAELRSQAQRALVGTNPVPVIVRVPDNSTLNPQGVLSITDLVPGVYMPLRAQLLVRSYTQMQKLDSMRCEEDPKGERITVTLSPAAKTDDPET